MWLPLDDPFVIFGLVVSGLILIVLIVLLTFVQRRSANDVWKSVKRDKKDPELAKPSQADNDTDSLMTETTVDVQDYTPVRTPSPVETVAPKTVRFSLPVEDDSSDITSERESPETTPETPPAVPAAETFDQIFDKWHSRSSDEIEVRPSNRRNMSERQLSELYFQYV